MKTRSPVLGLALASAAVLLTACGGGGSGGTDTGGGGGTPPATSTPTTTPVAVTVIDGALRNAMVCLDMNRSGTCDTGEPSARTDAAGGATLQVNPADVGKYPVLAVVGTDAVDADNGPVTTAFVMKAPADQSAVVSPLTTLVQTQVETTGASTTTAAATVQAQIGLNVSLFQDFTKSTAEEGATLNAIARTIVVTTQQQSQAIAGTVGQQAIDGSTITQQALDDLVARKMLEVLPTVVSQLSTPAVQAAIASGDPAQLNAALAPVVTNVVSSSGISASSVGTLVGIANQSQSAPAPAATPGPTASLTALTFNNPGSWFQRLFTGSTAQNTPDANGNTHATERRSRKTSNGALSGIAHWGFGGNPANQSDLHFNGSNWVRCSFDGGTVSGPRDAQGRSTYDYCDGVDVGVSTRAVFDVSGKPMLDVYNQARTAGYTNLNIANAASVLGSAVFPAESRLVYQTNSPLRTAVGYAPGVGSEVTVFPAAIAAGRTSPSDTSAACATITGSASAQAAASPATTLEGLVAANPGTPCVNSPNTITVPTTSGTPATVSSGTRNEWWSNSTVSVGTLGNAQVGAIQPATSPSYYTTNTLLRVAFAGNEARYYACQQRANDGSTRNCDLIGTGTYSISTLGDARILTLANTPVQAAALQERVFVERGGRVFLGYRNRTTPNSSARLNLPAANALLSTLGMEAVDPGVPFALTPASYQGDWLLWNAADTPAMATLLQIFPSYGGAGDTQSYRCVDPLGAQYSCSLTLDPATGAFTLVDTTANDGTLAGTLDMFGGGATGTFTPTSGTPETIAGRRR